MVQRITRETLRARPLGLTRPFKRVRAVKDIATIMLKRNSKAVPQEKSEAGRGGVVKDESDTSRLYD